MKKIKKLALSVALIALNFGTLAQVGIGTSTPNESAALDVESTTKGILFPRMTQEQRNAINTPVPAGLTVYCTDCVAEGKGELQTYNGSSWIGHNDFVPASGGTFSGEVKFDGKVGIGTGSDHTFNSGDKGLFINSNDQGRGTLAIGNGNNRTEIFTDGGSLYVDNITKEGSIVLRTNDGEAEAGSIGTERMRIDADGNVGIGTDDPQYKLDILENSNNGVRIRAGNEKNDIAFSVGSAMTPDKFVITAGGDVSIGSNDNEFGGYKFLVAAKEDFLGSTDNRTVLSIYNPFIGKGDNHIHFGLTNKENKTFNFIRAHENIFESNVMKFRTGTADTERMRINADGNILVGKSSSDFSTAGIELYPHNQVWVTSQTHGLAVNKLGEEGEIAKFYKNGVAVGSIGTDSGDLTFGSGFGAGGTNTKERMRIGANGWIRINSDSSWLRLIPNLGGGSFSPLSQAGDMGLIFSTDNNHLSDSTKGLVIAPHSNSANGLRILENGNVGIGTVEPKTKLHVVGDVKIEGNLTVGSETTTASRLVKTSEVKNCQKLTVNLSNYSSARVKMVAQRSNGCDCIVYWEGYVNNNNETVYFDELHKKSSDSTINYTMKKTDDSVYWEFNSNDSSAKVSITLENIINLSTGGNVSISCEP